MSIEAILTADSAGPTNSLLRSLLDSSPLAIYLLDLEGRVVLWNPAAEQLFGWPRNEVLGEFDPTVAANEAADVRAIIEDVVGGCALVDCEVVRHDRAGGRLEIALSAARVCDEAGAPQGMMAIAVNIGRRRALERERDHLLERERLGRAEAEAAERRATFLAEASALLDGSLDYTSTLNNLARLAVPGLADYCLIDELEDDFVSRVAIAHADPEQEGILLREVRQPLSEDPDKHPVVRVMLTGESVLVEEVSELVLAELAHSESHLAKLRQVDLRSFMVVPLETGGKILGTITFAHAKSRRRYSPADLAMVEELARRAALAVEAARLYRESRRAVQARERLLAIVSHDLRNSLATVLLNASAILESGAAPSLPRPVQDQIGWIARSADQMNRLIADLLDVSAIELGRLSLRPAAQSVERLVREAAQMCSPLAAEKGIDFTWECIPHLPNVLADAERLQQVLGNLLGNAVKFSSPGTSIVLRAYTATAAEVCFSVSDQGPGIEPADLPAIFELYWQGQRGRRSGAGLGLAIARAIVEAHGGRIWAESTPGVGSTFSFAVPRGRKDEE